MSLTFSRFTVVAIIALAVSTTVPRAQTAQPTEQELAIVRQFAVAESDADRAQLAGAHPWLKDVRGRTILNDVARAAVRQRMTMVAERAYLGLLWIGEANNNDRTRSAASVGLGQVEGELRGNLAKALELSQRGLMLGERADDFEAIQPALSNLGILHRRLGDFEKASSFFARALAMAEAIKRVDSAGRVYNNIGTLHYYQGNLALAREYFERSLALKRQNPGEETADYASTQANIGNLYNDIGDTKEAMAYLQKSIALYERLNELPRAILPLLSLARAQISGGQLADAEHTLARAMNIAEASDANAAIAQVLFLRGLVSRQRGELLEAVALQHRSLELQAGVQDVASLADSHVELSRLWLLRERPIDAETSARQAMTIAERARLLSQLAGAQFHLAQALEAQARSSEALAMFEAAVETVEQIRERALGEDYARQVFMRERLGPYTGLASLHARSGRPWEALRVIEQARARGLLDTLSFGRPPTTILSDDLRRREREVINSFAVATQELKAAERDRTVLPGAKAAAQQSFDQARLAYDAFKDEVYASHPRLRLTRGDAPVITRAELATLVPEGTAAIEFVVDPNHVWVYLTKGGAQGATVTAHRVSMPPASLLALADRFSRQVSTRDLAFAPTAKTLYTALLGDVDAQLASVDRLILVPDAALWSVPFQALLTPRDRYLVEERAVSYTPSLSALFALRKRSGARPSRAGTLVALGDPAERGAGSAQLPEARREVQALGQLYGAARSTVLVGTAATEAALRAAATSASVLHIASHGVLDDHGPMFSHVRLAPNRGDDGRLEAWELADLDLSADLVVLSACETARGAFGGGEGVIGLSWAVLAAGASSAVLSQWEVDSASTTSLMITFHQRLLKEPKGAAAAPDALRLASLSLLKDPRYRHPFYWAGFIVMGS